MVGHGALYWCIILAYGGFYEAKESSRDQFSVSQR